MLRLQREAAAEEPEASAASLYDTETGEVTSRAAPSAHGERDHAATLEFAVPAHASVEHIYWLEMARGRVMRGRPIMPGDGDDSDGDSGVSDNSGDGSDSGRVGSGSSGGTRACGPLPAATHPGVDLLPHGGTVGATVYGSGQQRARKGGTRGGERGGAHGSVERAGAQKRRPTAMWTCSGGRSWVKQAASMSTPAAPRRGGAAAQCAVGWGVGAHGPEGIEGAVWEALLLAREAEEVCSRSGYERAVWARRLLARQAAAAGAPGSQCALLPVSPTTYDKK